MSKQQADTKNVSDYFEKKVKKIGTIPIDGIFLGRNGVELSFDKKLTPTQQKKIKDGVLGILQENFYGSYELGNIEFDGFESLLLIKVTPVVFAL